MIDLLLSDVIFKLQIEPLVHIHVIKKLVLEKKAQIIYKSDNNITV